MESELSFFFGFWLRVVAVLAKLDFKLKGEGDSGLMEEHLTKRNFVMLAVVRHKISRDMVIYGYLLGSLSRHLRDSGKKRSDCWAFKLFFHVARYNSKKKKGAGGV